MRNPVDAEILAGFFEEARGYLPEIHDGLGSLAADPVQPGPIAELHRLFHSLKGAAGMVGLTDLGQMAKMTEDLLEEVSAGAVTVDGRALEALLTGTETVESYLGRCESGDFDPRGDVDKLTALYGALSRRAVNGALNPHAPIGPENGSGAGLDMLPPEDWLDDSPDDDMVAAFAQEAREQLDAVRTQLMGLGAETPEAGELRGMREGIQVLRGASSMVSFDEFGVFAGQVEELLGGLESGSKSWDEETAALLLGSIDGLEQMAQQSADASQIAPLAEQLSVQAVGGSPAAPRASTIPAGMPEDDTDVPEELIEAFRAEAEEHLQTITESLRVLAGAPADKARLQDVRRAMHTLKGAAGMVGLRRASRMAHRAEDLLDELYDNEQPLTKDAHQLLLATADVIADMTAEDAVAPVPNERLLEILSGYDGAVGGEAVPAEPAAPAAPAEVPEPPYEPESVLAPEPVASPVEAVPEPAPPAAAPEPKPALAPPSAPPRPAPPTPPPVSAPSLTPSPAPAVAASAAVESRNAPMVRVPLDRLDELVRLVSELVVNRSTFEQHFGRYIHEVDELGLSTERLRRASVKLETDYAVSALIAQEAGASAGAGPVIRTQTPATDSQNQFDTLEFDRYTDFHLLSRDITETTADVASTSHQFTSLIGDFDGYLTRLGRLTSEVQDRLMRLRMVPISSVASRLQRTVRVTARRQQKQVNVHIEGGATELDKTVLEEITGPLEHLLRNSVDHGIEPEETRIAAGKPGEGTIRIRSYYEGTQVVILVSDDGGGLDPDRLRAKAVDGGFLSQRDAERIPEEELYAFVFETGFSTAKQLSEVSGRGVGLDIVKSTVNKLKGSVSIESERGAGVTFRIRLPMSLAVARVLMVEAGGERMAIPLAAVSQIRRADPEQLERVGDTPVVRFEDRVMPALHLGEALGLPNSKLPDGRIPVLSIQSGDKQIGLIVESILEAREVVVKTLGNLLRRVPGVSGATLMGDGGVVLIVNPAEIVEDTRKARRQVHPRRSTARTPRSKTVYDILIVDDSLSVRRVLTNLIRSAGWSSTQAKDGMEALDVLNRSPKAPDCILLDIEMPRMDGYELTHTLRSMEAFRKVPIIMLTSRSGEKHRARAFELGATDYLVKPYQDDAMLSAVRRVIADARIEAQG